jgi:curved DNA-binding protein CbpA
MSHLRHCLDLLGFNDLEDVTADSLKKAFKVTVLKAHPDKGGQQDDFDSLLSAYLYLLDIMNRLRGGRRTLHDVVSPEELKESRLDEIVNRIFEEFQREEFNAAFEAQNPRRDHGYADWLHDAKEDVNVVEGAFGSATQVAPTISEKELHAVFERSVKEGKPAPATALILHPDEMAYVSGSIMGTSILDTNTGCYTSDLYQTPEYTDVYAAFSKDNTLCDKIAPFVESGKTLEELVAERKSNDEIRPLQDAELEAIAQFEKNKQLEQEEHLRKIKDYYENHLTGGALNNWSSTVSTTESNQNFVIQL